MSNYALILAGGTGSRLGAETPKQFLFLDNRPIVIHTLLAFQQHPDIQGIGVICLNGWESILASFAHQYGITKLNWIFPGGQDGQESIYNGISGLKEAGCSNEDLVLIHDAVRPMISQTIISSNIAICRRYGYAITGIPCREALLISEDGFSGIQSLPRDKVIRTQTPQTFRLGDILRAHEDARMRGLLHSVASCTLLAELGGYEMHIVGNIANNFVAFWYGDRW